MKVCVLASGSRGNCTYIELGSHHILIDLGTTSLATEKRLREIGVDPSSIDSILVTHSHVDHVSGLRVFIKKYHPTVYLTPKIFKDIRESLQHAEIVFVEDCMQIDDFQITSFKTSHDTEESLGYLLTYEDKSIVYVTDTGYISEKNLRKIQNKEVYVMESNHDVTMLMDGGYPYSIKQRILGDRGHLSNMDSAYYLSKMIGDKTEKVFLAHLSKENNTEEMALSTLQAVLEKNEIAFKNISVARQDEVSEVVEV